MRFVAKALLIATLAAGGAMRVSSQEDDPDFRRAVELSRENDPERAREAVAAVEEAVARIERTRASDAAGGPTAGAGERIARARLLAFRLAAPEPELRRKALEDLTGVESLAASDATKAEALLVRALLGGTLRESDPSRLALYRLGSQEVAIDAEGVRLLEEISRNYTATPQARIAALHLAAARAARGEPMPDRPVDSGPPWSELHARIEQATRLVRPPAPPQRVLPAGKASFPRILLVDSTATCRWVRFEAPRPGTGEGVVLPDLEGGDLPASVGSTGDGRIEALQLEGLPIPGPGIYHVSEETPYEYAERVWVATDLALLGWEDGPNLEFTAVRRGSGEPVEGAMVAVWQRAGGELRILSHGATGADGRYVYEPGEAEREEGPRVGALAVWEGHVAWIGDMYLPIEGSPWRRESYFRLFIASASPVYRPGEQIGLAVAVRRYTKLSIEAAPEVALRLEVVDPNGEEAFRTELRTDPFGIAATSFQLPEDVEPGEFDVKVELLDPKKEGYTLTERAGFRVDEAKPPGHEIEISQPAGPVPSSGPVQVTLWARDLSGVPVAGLRGYWSAYEVGGARADRAPGRPDWLLYDYEWMWRNENWFSPLEGGEFVTDEKGEAALSFLPVISPGGCRVRLGAWATHPDGTHLETSIEFPVPPDPSATARETDADRGTRSAAGTDNLGVEELQLLISPERTYAFPGETIKSRVEALGGEGSIHLRLVADRTVERWVLDAGAGPHEVSFVVPEGRGPVLALCGVLVSKGRATGHRVNLTVDPHRHLRVELVPDAERSPPGKWSRLGVRVTDDAGRPAVARVVLAIADEAAESEDADRRSSLYEAFPLPRPHIDTSVDAGEMLLDAGLEDAGEDPYIDGWDEPMSDSGGSPPPPPRARLRRDFRSVAHWTASVLSDSAGRASVGFPLPDSLTRWRATAYAFGTGDQAGEGSTEFETWQPFQIQPELPLFLGSRDEVLISCRIINETGSDAPVEVSLEAEGVEILDPAAKRKRVPRAGSVVSSWRVRVSDPSEPASTPHEAILRFRAEGREVGDAIEARLPVRPHWVVHVEEENAWVQEGPVAEPVFSACERPGELEISLSGDLAAVLDGALDRLSDDRYRYDRAIAARLLASIALHQAMRKLDPVATDPNPLPGGFAREDFSLLLKRRNDDGGWGSWWLESGDPWATALAVRALVHARSAGVDVPDEVLVRAEETLRKSLWKELGTREGPPADLVGALAESLALAGGDELPDGVREAVAGRRPYAQARLAIALFRMGREEEAREMLARLQEGTVRDGGRLTFLDDREEVDATDPVVATAAALEAHLAIAPEDEGIRGMVAWLLSERKGHVWGSEQATSGAIVALAQYLETRGSRIPRGTFEVEAGSEVFRGSLSEVAFEPRKILIAIPSREPMRIAVRMEGEGPLFVALCRRTFEAREDLVADSGRFTIRRSYHLLSGDSADPERRLLGPGDEIPLGSVLEASFEIEGASERSPIAVEDLLPSGCEPLSEGSWAWWEGWTSGSSRSGRLVLPAWHRCAYRLRARHPGVFHVLPAELLDLDNGKILARSAESRLTLTDSLPPVPLVRRSRGNSIAAWKEEIEKRSDARLQPGDVRTLAELGRGIAYPYLVEGLARDFPFEADEPEIAWARAACIAECTDFSNPEELRTLVAAVEGFTPDDPDSHDDRHRLKLRGDWVLLAIERLLSAEPADRMAFLRFLVRWMRPHDWSYGSDGRLLGIFDRLRGEREKALWLRLVHGAAQDTMLAGYWGDRPQERGERARSKAWVARVLEWYVASENPGIRVEILRILSSLMNGYSNGRWGRVIPIDEAEERLLSHVVEAMKMSRPGLLAGEGFKLRVEVLDKIATPSARLALHELFDAQRRETEEWVLLLRTLAPEAGTEFLLREYDPPGGEEGGWIVSLLGGRSDPAGLAFLLATLRTPPDRYRMDSQYEALLPMTDPRSTAALLQGLPEVHDEDRKRRVVEELDRRGARIPLPFLVANLCGEASPAASACVTALARQWRVERAAPVREAIEEILGKSQDSVVRWELLALRAESTEPIRASFWKEGDPEGEKFRVFCEMLELPPAGIGPLLDLYRSATADPERTAVLRLLASGRYPEADAWLREESKNREISDGLQEEMIRLLGEFGRMEALRWLQDEYGWEKAGPACEAALRIARRLDTQTLLSLESDWPRPDLDRLLASRGSASSPRFAKDFADSSDPRNRAALLELLATSGLSAEAEAFLTPESWTRGWERPGGALRVYYRAGGKMPAGLDPERELGPTMVDRLERYRSLARAGRLAEVLDACGDGREVPRAEAARCALFLEAACAGDAANPYLALEADPRVEGRIEFRWPAPPAPPEKDRTESE
ncbi:MAG: hypothetical protein HY720_22955 [Planctomycetes bacterium]|nr:hypothetical protein [Planctomycetota bacterium]